jgi:hypothetical protein
MQLVGAILAVLGAALIVLAALEVAAAMLGDAILVGLVVGGTGALLLGSGGWMMVHEPSSG